MDKLDRRILKELDLDSRQSMSQLARKLRFGRDTVEYRFQKLTEQGVIQRCSAIIDPYKLGLTIYKTYLKLENKRTRRDALLNFLSEHPRVYWIAECDGRWDMMFSVFATSAFEFYELQQKALSLFEDVVLSFDVFTLINLHLFHKSYFGKVDFRGRRIGGAPCVQRLDDTEFSILKILSENARESVPSIAGLVQSTPAIVRSRIKSMEEREIIAGYRVEVDLQKLGMIFFKAQLYLHHFGEKEIEALRASCLENIYITYFVEQLGACRVEIEVEATSYEAYLEVLQELRSKHCGLIRNIETNLISREHFHWIPRGIRLFATERAKSAVTPIRSERDTRTLA